MQSHEEPIDYLVDTHFPGNILYDSFLPAVCPLWAILPLPYITDERDTAVLSLFGPHKVAGLGGIKPCVLQHLPLKIISCLTVIFQTSVQTGHSPLARCQSKVVFIPKPGKDDYTNV
jgi:hypothetical protein